MRQRKGFFGIGFVTVILGVTVFAACGNSDNSSGFSGSDDASGGSGGSSGGGSGSGSGGSGSGSSSGSLLGDGNVTGLDAMLLGDGDFGNDPPPSWCGMGPDPDDAGVYGTINCPSDKNREGCPCGPIGTKAACWTGLRVDRGVGVCKDGMTTCIQNGEGPIEWGPCVGEVLPNPAADAGAQACQCFSTGQWAIQNVEPCIFTNGSGQATAAVSTWINAGIIQCPTNNTPPIAPQPGQTWSPDTISADCAGTFTLCYTIKAGDPNKPMPSDCVVGQSCTKGYVPAANVVTTLPDLPSWQSTNVTCTQQFATSGGYGEMSVYGESVRCEMIGSMSQPYVFERNPYCALMHAPDAGCQSGGSGSF